MKKNRLFAQLIASLLVLTSLAGCNNSSNSSDSTSQQDAGSSDSTSTASETSSAAAAEPGEVQLPIVDEKITVTWFAGLDSNLTTLVSNMNETPFFQDMEEKTNIHIEFQHPPTGSETSAYNLLFASGDLPDLISHQNPGYSGGLDACLDDGYILDLTELVPQYCPNYMKALNDLSEKYDENVLRSAYTGSGRIGAVGQLMQQPQGPWAGLYVRGDWLEKCGLETPQTFEDWETMLTAFKDECGATAPMLLHKTGYDNVFNNICMGFGVTPSWYQVDGQVKFGPAEEGWRDYVTMMHDWYQKGLIDPDFMASTSPASILPDTAMVTTGKTGAFVGVYTNVAMWEAAIEGDEDNFVPVYTPMPNAGDTHNFQSVILSGASPTMGLSISADSEYAIECLKMFDYWFSEEGAMYCNWGIEGDTYQLDENNEPKYTDKIISNPDGLSFAQAMAYYTFPPARPVYQDWTRELEAVPAKDVVCYDVWGQGTNSEAMPAPGSLNMDPELYTEFSTIMTDIQTVVDEKTPQFISGVISLDEYDAYQTMLQDMGMARAVEIVQQAYEDFMAR
ncbi:MAG TPA: extracellular solute-binding protein [Candidatus Faecivivens stercorigallinarum]|nr:extracellular solute-binding protein [Candidatus Faecivivens stercorigallinarum]